MQGVHATLRNAFSSSVQNYIIASRMKQGQMDMDSASVAEREDVVVRWNNVKFDLKNFQAMKLKEQREKQRAEGEGPYGQPEKSLTAPVTGWAHTRKLSFEERKQLHARKEAWKKGHVEAIVPASRSDLSLSEPSSMSAAEDEEFERAIRVSVAETSRGNAEEDAAVEQAIRASVNHFRSSGVPDIRAEKAAPLDRDAKNQDQDPFSSAELEITDEEYQRLIEEAINQSMSLKAAGVQPGEGSHGDDEEFHRALEQSKIAQQQPPAHEDDEELQRILEESKRQHAEGNTNEEEELRKAIEASEAAHREQQNKDAAARTEEDVVMEYVKKQSLAEEEFRRNASKGKGRDVAADVDEDEDEELRRAMEESLKMSGRPGGSSSYQ